MPSQWPIDTRETSLPLFVGLPEQAATSLVALAGSTTVELSQFILPVAKRVNAVSLYGGTLVSPPQVTNIGIYDDAGNLICSGQAATPNAPATPFYYAIARALMVPALLLQPGLYYLGASPVTASGIALLRQTPRLAAQPTGKAVQCGSAVTTSGAMPATIALTALSFLARGWFARLD